MNRQNAPIWLLRNLKWLCLVLIVASGGLVFVYGEVMGYSVLLGGLIYVLPNYIAVKREAFIQARRGSIEHEVLDQQGVLKQMYAFVMIKVVSTVILFAAVYYFVDPLLELLVLIGFVAAFVFNFVLSTIMANRYADELFKEGEI